MMKNSIIIFASLFLITVVGCGGNDEESSKSIGKKFAEGLMENIIEHAAKKDGKDIDVNIDLDNVGKDGVMTVTDEDGKEIKISAEDGKLSVSGENGEEVVFEGSENEIPKSLPSDVYVVDGNVEAAGTMKSSEGEVLTFSIKTKENFKDIIAKISKEMQANGWKSTMNMDMGGNAMQVYTKDDNSATITSKKNNDSVEVAYMVTVKIKEND